MPSVPSTALCRYAIPIVDVSWLSVVSTSVHASKCPSGKVHEHVPSFTNFWVKASQAVSCASKAVCRTSPACRSKHLVRKEFGTGTLSAFASSICSWKVFAPNSAGSVSRLAWLLATMGKKRPSRLVVLFSLWRMSDRRCISAAFSFSVP